MRIGTHSATAPDQQAGTVASVIELLQRAWVTPASWAAIELLQQAPLVMSIDTLSCFSRAAIPGAAKYLTRLTGEPVTPKEIKLDNGYVVGWTFSITRPHDKLPQISEWMLRTGATANEMHIAGDYMIPNLNDRAAAWEFLRRHTWVKNGARVARMTQGYPTAYSDDFTGRGKTARNFGLYMKGDDRLRLEARLWKPPTLRRYIHTDNPVEILGYAPGYIFANEFRLRFVRAATVNRWVKQQEAKYGKSRYKWTTGTWEHLMQHADRDWLKNHTKISRFTLAQHAEWQL
jgi:hypothetical protein